MKRPYKAPALEIEVYRLDANIAGNCSIPVNNGPAIANTEYLTACSDYSAWEDASGSGRSRAVNVNFYEDTPSACDCYTTGANAGFWTS